jgi:hypothetical protein
MKIVNLDGVTTNPGDLSWDGMKKLILLLKKLQNVRGLTVFVG